MQLKKILQKLKEKRNNFKKGRKYGLQKEISNI